MKFMKNALVILAGGKGERFGQEIPKQFYKIGKDTVLDVFLRNLDMKPFKYIVLAINKKYIVIVEFHI